MPPLWFFGVLGLAALVQAVAGPALHGLLGARPDLVLVLVATWALLRGAKEGGWAGLCGGLLLDLFSLTPFGLHALVLGVLGTLIGLGQGNLRAGQALLLVTTAALATVALHGTIYLVLQAAGWALPSVSVFARAVGPSSAANGLLLAVAFRLGSRATTVAGGWRRIEL